jgi:hypothetical protein
MAMTRRFLLGTLLALFAWATVGCSTSSNVVVNPGSSIVAKSAYVVLHAGNSSDMDAHIQRELMAHGIRVTAGAEMQKPDADIIVRYSDSWRWDLTMYLKTLDVQVYDASSGTLIASGSWKNSALHGYHGAEGVVKEVFDQIFAKLKAP